MKRFRYSPTYLYVVHTFHFPLISNYERMLKLTLQETIFPGKYAVYTACYFRRVSLVEAFIQHSADIDEEYDGMSSIKMAINRITDTGMMSVINVLLLNGASTRDIATDSAIVPKVLRHFDADLKRLFLKCAGPNVYRQDCIYPWNQRILL